MSAAVAGPHGQQQASGMHMPGSIWAKLIDEKSGSKQGGRQDTNIYFIGSDTSGKSTLVQRYLYAGKADAAKPSPGLEFTFARKAAAYDSNRKDVAHIWELSGGSDLAAQLTQGSHIFLTHRQVSTAVVVIVLDLSNPAGVLPSALHWLSAVRAKLAATYGLFERRGLAQLPQQLRARQRTKVLGQQHPDAQLVECTGVSLVLACTKWDALRNTADPEALRLLAHSLRWLAHSNAAHLLYLGDLQPGAKGSEGPKLLDHFTRLLNHLAFVGMDRRIPLRQQPTFDHMGPLLIPAGADSFASIGLPLGGPQAPLGHRQAGGAGAGAAGGASLSTAGWCAADVAAGQQAWLAGVETVLPAKTARAAQQQLQKRGQQAGPNKAAAFSAAYREEEVDAAHAQREAALEAYRQEQQEARRSSRRKTGSEAASKA